MKQLNLFIPAQAANDGALFVQNATKIDAVQSHTERLDIRDHGQIQADPYLLKTDRGVRMRLPAGRAAMIIKAINPGVKPNTAELAFNMNPELNQLLGWLAINQDFDSLPELVTRVLKDVYPGISNEAIINLVGVAAGKASVILRAVQFPINRPNREDNIVSEVWVSQTKPFFRDEGDYDTWKPRIGRATEYRHKRLSGAEPLRINPWNWFASLPILALHTPSQNYDPQELLGDHRKSTDESFQSIAVAAEAFASTLNDQQSADAPKTQLPVFVAYKE